MPQYGAVFGRGVLIGASAAILYRAAREAASFVRGPQGDGIPRPVPEPSTGGLEVARPETLLMDWGWAERVAVRASGQAPVLHPAARAALQSNYVTLLREIEGPIATYTGNDLSLGQTVVEVMDRPAWIHANMANFRELLQPVEDFYRETAREYTATAQAGAQGVQRAAQLVLSTQFGVLVGYLARRVLGQYDLGLMAADATRGKLYFVEPNLLHIEQSLGVPPDELRRWIALHEATHAHEFELHPWVRQYLESTMRAYLDLLLRDMKRQGGRDGDGLGVLMALVARFTQNVRRGHNLLNALMSEEQRALVSQLQALMSLAEGYSNHVMNAVGKTLLPHFDLIHERVEHRRRERTQAELLFLRVTGLSMKMEQYKRGEEFVDHVVRERGIRFVNRAWEGPELLPTEDEIRAPEQWIARVERIDAALDSGRSAGAAA